MSPSTSSTRSAMSARFSRLPDEKLSITRTRSPRAISARASDDPMNPAPPVTRQRLIAELPRRLFVVEPGFDGEAGDHFGQHRIHDLGHRGRNWRIFQPVGRVGSQRANRQPRSQDGRGNNPEDTWFCRHMRTLSYLYVVAIFPSSFPHLCKLRRAHGSGSPDRPAPNRPPIVCGGWPSVDSTIARPPPADLRSRATTGQPPGIATDATGNAPPRRQD